MLTKQWLCTVKGIDPSKRTLTAYASTNDLDRDGEIVEAAAWTETIAQRPSVPLVWAHDYKELPLGRATGFSVDNRGLKFRAEFAKHSRANEVFDLYREGALDSFSVGFISKGASDGKYGGPKIHTSCELLEVSCVVVPSNASARVLRALRQRSGRTDPLVREVALAATGACAALQQTPEYKRYPTEDSVIEMAGNVTALATIIFT